MSDEMQMGGNALEELKRRVQRRIENADAVDELKLELKDFKDEDKADGYTEKIIAQAVKEMRADPEKILKMLTLEAELHVARKALGLPTDIESAQHLAKDDAEQIPEPKRRGKKGGGDDAAVSSLDRPKPDRSKH